MSQLNQYNTILKGDLRNLGIDFGFNAIDLYLENSGGVPLRINLQTSVATTDDFELKAGKTLELQDLRVQRMGLTTSSTSTSTGDAGNQLAILALG